MDFNAGYNGDVELSHISQQLRFKSVRTDLQLAKLDGELSMGHGDIRATSAVGPVKLNTRSNEVHLEEISGAVEVENRNGLVELQPKRRSEILILTMFAVGSRLTCRKAPTSAWTRKAATAILR